MRLIIAGGRDFKPQPHHVQWLNILDSELSAARTPITVVISGCAPGADTFGEKWARENELPVAQFLANWSKYGKSAGPRRNAEMARSADGVVLFPGGKGTQNMFETAEAAGLRIWDWRERRE